MKGVDPPHLSIVSVDIANLCRQNIVDALISLLQLEEAVPQGL